MDSTEDVEKVLDDDYAFTVGIKIAAITWDELILEPRGVEVNAAFSVVNQ
jgi:hypothetical protein